MDSPIALHGIIEKNPPIYQRYKHKCINTTNVNIKGNLLIYIVMNQAKSMFHFLCNRTITTKYKKQNVNVDNAVTNVA